MGLPGPDKAGNRMRRCLDMTNSEMLLREGCSALGIKCNDRQIQSFQTYLQELKKWNRACNLTGLKSDQDIIIKHFLDSLTFFVVFPRPVSSLADIGSGAGFPGIPLKIIAPDIMAYLIEPNKKKAVFLRHMVKILGLDQTEIIEKRLEEIRDIKVEIVVTRALFKIRDMIEKARHLAAPGGSIILSKGPKAQQELQDFSLQSMTVRQITLPFVNIVRHLIVVPSQEDRTLKDA